MYIVQCMEIKSAVKYNSPGRIAVVCEGEHPDPQLLKHPEPRGPGFRLRHFKKGRETGGGGCTFEMWRIERTS
jgi:hypothetical protein